MIQSAFWNGIDFSGNFNRENALFNFEAQRVKNVLPVATLGTLCFETSSDEYNYIFIRNLTNGTAYGTNRASILNLTSGFLVFLISMILILTRIPMFILKSEAEPMHPTTHRFFLKFTA